MSNDEYKMKSVLDLFMVQTEVFSKGGFILLLKVLYVDMESPLRGRRACRRPTLLLYVRIQYF